ncbi:flagellar biosynthesis protein FlgJ [Pikeienuella sp. HZG-20]|uniref:flagellar biosynthesis protein FlgJ n=1 Tax=Paludibacillus litoralis TaxID=3133267 RepID=UPI0030EF6B1F
MDPIAALTARHTPPAAPARGPDAPLREAATKFEAVFLAEMFAHTGLGATRESNGGGAGEEAFSSFLAREWADKVAAAGGVGLSERIYQALAAREAGDA